FDTEEEARAAQRVLLSAGLGVERVPDGTPGPAAPSASPARPARGVVDARADEGSRVARTLGQAGIYPAELSVDRPSLEDVFLELTGEEAPVAGVPLGIDGTGTPS